MRATAPLVVPAEEETADEDLAGDGEERAEAAPMQKINPAGVDNTVDQHPRPGMHVAVG